MSSRRRSGRCDQEGGPEAGGGERLSVQEKWEQKTVPCQPNDSSAYRHGERRISKSRHRNHAPSNSQAPELGVRQAQQSCKRNCSSPKEDQNYQLYRIQLGYCGGI